MKHKDPTEVTLAAIRKTTRSDIRLEHSIAADEEINGKLPAIENEFWYGVSSQTLLGYDREAQQIVLAKDTRNANVQPKRKKGEWAPSRIATTEDLAA